MTEHLEFIVDENHTGERIDKYLSAVMPGQSRSYIQKLIKDASVFADLKPVKSSYKVILGEHIQVAVPEPVSLDIRPENIPLDIIYEDQDVILINKPKDMVVHPAAGHYQHTLVNALMFHCKGRLSGINGMLRPGIVHRIDKDTTGTLVVCKTDRAHQALASQLAVHSITRKYRAIIHGTLSEDQLTIEGPIGRHPTERKKMAVNLKNGKPAVTHVNVLGHFKGYSYIECVLETGRTHQIRVHLASIGHPLLGDVLYGPKKCPFSGLQGQTLHAMVLGFQHPVSGNYMEFTAPLPEYFQKLLIKLS